MRTFAKSFIRLSMAMTAFSAQQARELLRDLGDDDEAEDDSSIDRVAAAMDELSSDMQKHLRKRAGSVYEAGDKFQTEVVDLMFDSVDTEEWKPRRVIERAADLAEKSADALRDAVKDEDETETADE